MGFQEFGFQEFGRSHVRQNVDGVSKCPHSGECGYETLFSAFAKAADFGESLAKRNGASRPVLRTLEEPDGLRRSATKFRCME
jgi:hypothetical protein